MLGYKIKNCPRCNETSWVFGRVPPSLVFTHWRYFIRCMHCGIQGPRRLTMEFAIRAWNKDDEHDTVDAIFDDVPKAREKQKIIRNLPVIYKGDKDGSGG